MRFPKSFPKVVLSPIPQPRLLALVLAGVLFSSLGVAHGDGVEAPRFSESRGFYDNPFALTMDTGTTGATIHYTLDGSDPLTSARVTSGSSPVTLTIDPESDYDGRRIRTSPAVVLRVVATLEGREPSATLTQTYIFPHQVPTQSPDVTPPIDYAAGHYTDASMNSVIVERYGEEFPEALTSIPTVSMVLDDDHFWSRENGIHNGFHIHRSDLEHPASMELIYDRTRPEFAGFAGFQENAGIKMQGGWSRGGYNETEGARDHKQSFAFVFRRQYGTGTLRYPVMESSPIPQVREADRARYDRLILRSGYNECYGNRYQYGRSLQQNYTTTRDEFGRSSQVALDGTGSKGTFVHLYINGIYWGIYNLVERTDHKFAEHNFGGYSGDYYFWKNKEGGRGGDASRHNAINSILETHDYERINEYFDTKQYINWLLVMWHGGTGDLQFNRTILNNPGRPLRTHIWDYEDSLWSQRSAEPGIRFSGFSGGNMTEHWDRLRVQEEFRMELADKVYQHLFHDGELSPAKTVDRWNRLAEFLNPAIVADLARWGDSHVHISSEDPIDRDRDWITAWHRVRDRLHGATSTLFANIKSQGYYPDTDPPQFNQHGGVVSPGFSLDMANPNDGGTIFYRSDGRDPRRMGGEVQPGTQTYDGAITLTRTTHITARVLRNGEWSALARASFLMQQGQDLTALKFTEIMYQPADQRVAADRGIHSVVADATIPKTDGKAENFRRGRIRLTATPPSGLTRDDVIVISGSTDSVNDGRYEISHVEGVYIYTQSVLPADESSTDARADLYFGGNRYDFLTIKNTGAAMLDLTGVRVRGINYAFPPGTRLTAGAFYVIAKNKFHFTDHYGFPPNDEFEPSNLSNNGERLRLVDPLGNVLTTVIYGITTPWPEEAAGGGHSLVPVLSNPRGNQDHPVAWRASALPGGSPGADDPASHRLPENHLTLHQWDFEDPMTFLEPSVSLLAGALVVTPQSPDVIRNDPAQDFATAHLRVNNPIGKELRLDLPTTGFSEVVLLYETRRSGMGAGLQIVEYTTNGTDWAPLQSHAIENESPQSHFFEFSGLDATDNNPDFAVRITFAEGEGGTAGNNRFDNITLIGSPLPGTNLPPVVASSIPNQSLVEGGASGTLSLGGVFADPDGDSLSYAVSSGSPEVLTATVSGNSVSMVPHRRGEAMVTVTASDGNYPPVATSFHVLVYPAAHRLAFSPFSWGAWSADEPAGRFPPHMIFLQGEESDSSLFTPLPHAYHIPASDANEPQDPFFPYAATSRTRINGLGDEGIAFINTGRGRDLGGALLALDTRGVESVPVSWLGGTVLPNVRDYAIRLQYRVGHSGPFTDLIDAATTPAETLPGMIAFYPLHEGDGNIAYDDSGYEEQLNLTLSGGVQWLPGGGVLLNGGAAKLQSSGAAGKLHNRITTTGAFSVETWIRPSILNQEGPARIVSYSQGGSARNFTLSHGVHQNPNSAVTMRLRTTASGVNNNGQPDVQSANLLNTDDLQHVVATYDGSTLRIYRDGEQIATDSRGGTLGNWDASYPLILGNETSGDRGWAGELHSVAIYDRALTGSEIENSYQSGHGTFRPARPVVYVRNEMAGHMEAIGPVALPEEALGREYVQLLWRYHRVSGDSGPRAQLRLDDIMVASDGDGSVISTPFDDWRASQFSSMELQDPAVSAPGADPDESGIHNLLRYALGLDRYDDHNDHLPHLDDAAGDFILRFPRLINSSDHLEYRIDIADASEGAFGWFTADEGVDYTIHNITPTGDGRTEIVEALIPIDTLDTARFFRLQVRLQGVPGEN